MFADGFISLMRVLSESRPFQTRESVLIYLLVVGVAFYAAIFRD